jgi:hypothetical protein
MGNGVIGWHQGVMARQNFCDRGGRVAVGTRFSYILVTSMRFLKFNYLSQNCITGKMFENELVAITFERMRLCAVECSRSFDWR